MLSLRWETFIAFWLRAGKQETYTRSRKFAFHQTTGRLRTFILVKTNPFLFWKLRSNFRLVMKRSQPGRERSFKGREALHTVLRTTRNCRRACWGLLPRQDLRISSKNLRDQSRHSIRRRCRLAKTKSIDYWRPRRNMAFRFCRRRNEVIPCSKKSCPQRWKSSTAAPLCFQRLGTADSIGGSGLCRYVRGW